jgi:choline-sulfatase
MRLLKVVLALALGLAGVPAFAQTRPNLILISVDTLRQDHLGLYGYPRNTSPNVDELLRRGVWFSNASSNIPLTNPSFASLFTSRYPHETGATRNGVPMIDARTLAEILKANGYATAAFLSNWPLKAKISNLQKGFDIYDDNFFKKRWLIFNNERDAKGVTDLAAEWLDSGPKRPFFLWAHYSEPHAPYVSHRGYGFTSKGPGPPEEQGRVDAYDSEIAYADHFIGELVKKIKSLGLDRDSLIVFMADHGEELGEKGYWGHGRYVYEGSIRVPLGFSGPGIAVDRKVDNQVELLDLAPTMLAYAGIPAGKDMKGRDLIPYLEGRKTWPAHYLIYYETYPGAVRGEGAEKIADLKKPTWIGLKMDELKVSYRLASSHWEMFNLKNDPGEEKNLADPVNKNFIVYSNHLLAWYKGWEKYAVIGRTDLLNEEDRKRLEALGYLK